MAIFWGSPRISSPVEKWPPTGSPGESPGVPDLVKKVVKTRGLSHVTNPLIKNVALRGCFPPRYGADFLASVLGP